MARGDPAGRESPNSRTGPTPKTVQTEVGPVAFDQRPVPGLLHRAGRTALADWLFMRGIDAALTFGFGMGVAAVTGALLYTLVWVASFPLENDPILDHHVLGAVSIVVLGSPSGRGQGMWQGRSWSGRTRSSVEAPSPTRRPPRGRDTASLNVKIRRCGCGLSWGVTPRLDRRITSSSRRRRSVEVLDPGKDPR